MNPLALKQNNETNKNDWCTPPWLFKRLHEIFNFDIDGASDGINNLLPNYHTSETPYDVKVNNSQQFNIFVNPPFNEDVLQFFNSSCKFTCLLLPFRPETRKWHDYIWQKATIFVFNKRIQYIHPEKKIEVKGAAFPSCLVLFGDLSTFPIDKLNDLGVFVKKFNALNKEDNHDICYF